MNKTNVEALPVLDRRYLVRDTLIPGFGVRVEPSGRKTFVLRMWQWITLGSLRDLTAEEARTKAERLRGDAAKGIKSPSGKGRTFKDAADKFMAEHAEVHLKPRTVTDYKALLALWIIPKLGLINTGLLGLEDIKGLHREIGKGHERTANKALLLISSILAKAEEWGWREPNSNPCAAVTKFKDVERTRHLSGDEIALLLIALDTYQASNPIACDVIRVLLFTGRRLNEIQTLRWSELDEKNGLIAKETKTGRKVFAVDDASLKILKRQTRGGEWVFTGLGGNSSVAAEKFWQKRKADIGLDDVRLHDLRHTLASHALDSGIDSKLVGGLLGQVDRRSMDRYTHIFAERLREKANAAQKSVVKAGQAGKRKALGKLAKG